MSEPKKLSRSKLIKKADKLYSLYVRNSNRAEDRTVKCFTCNYVGTVIHCGHYVTRVIKYTRWHLDNLRPQCFFCNIRKKGNSHVYRRRLVKEIGEERVSEVEALAEGLFKEKDEWIQERIDYIVDKAQKEGISLIP